jgi:hypothetical protein
MVMLLFGAYEAVKAMSVILLAVTKTGQSAILSNPAIPETRSH